MRRRRARTPVLAGEIRSSLGRKIDQVLPLAGHRSEFRRWRHTRPFWAGVLVMIAGAVLIYYPLGEWSAMMAIAASAFTGIALGLIMILGGLFFWFAPHQRTFVALVLMICSVLSLVVANFGGFLLGMVFGMLGSSMAFGWRPGVHDPRTDAPESAGKGASGRAVTVAVIATLIAVVLVNGLGHAPAVARGTAPPVGCGTTSVQAAQLAASDVTIKGTRTLRVLGDCPPVEVVHLHIARADVVDYVLESPRTSTGQVLRIETGLRISDIDLYVTELAADIDIVSVLPIELPAGLPLPTGSVPINPRTVGILESAGLLGPRQDDGSRRGLTLPRLNTGNARWGQPFIDGEVTLIDPSLRVRSGPALTPIE